ncbi:MAG: 30S ribosomal protein S15 [Treponema sp.]|nr:30S ribosomal protein S15 [Spirochaetia bacterium]MDD7579590.1 30S ribosomal protein S15 [Treponema sp.]MCI7440239.1 30S ribosomal protein S15 [Spirochaetia bacterium]MDY3758339.1 30S ribosomal protein S15 [Treponema sp.]MDY4130342.1 30S ribosomal protein S15 [Treponema sp.]
MALTKEVSSSIVSKFGANANDTGNVKVQIALLTERIKQLTAHCKAFPKDTGASRGLLKVVGSRRSLLKYMQRTNLEGYRALIKELGIRK